jgi:hypothetical protein
MITVILGAWSYVSHWHYDLNLTLAVSISHIRLVCSAATKSLHFINRTLKRKSLYSNKENALRKMLAYLWLQMTESNIPL